MPKKLITNFDEKNNSNSRKKESLNLLIKATVRKTELRLPVLVKCLGMVTARRHKLTAGEGDPGWVRLIPGDGHSRGAAAQGV